VILATYLLVPQCDRHCEVYTSWHPPLRRLPHARMKADDHGVEGGATVS
jgi:hypothetical protein